MNMLILFISIFLTAVLGGGGFLLLYLKTRPPVESWTIRIYQVSEGTRALKNSKGEKVYNLADLIPYRIDTVQKTSYGPGEEIYGLRILGKTTQAVEADMVENWGHNQKEVCGLLKDGTVTLLKKGYDKDIGAVIFTPLHRERIELIKSEIVQKQERLKQKKNLLQAITPWIVTGVLIIGLICIVYMQVSGSVQISENLEEGNKYFGDKYEKSVNTLRDALKEIKTEAQVPNPNLGKQPKPPPASVE